MTDNNMPRGMLRGCQRHVDNLEKSGVAITLLMAFIVAFPAFLYRIFVQILNSSRKREWWHDLPS